MNVICNFLGRWFLGLLVSVCCISAYAQSDNSTLATQRGRAFLTGLLDVELDLLPEYRGAKVYWLYHDNYLAAKVLEKSHPAVAKTLREAIQREGVHESGKIEIVFGEAKQPLPFRQYQLVDVRQVTNKVIRTEIVTTNVFKGWTNYADLLLLASIAEKDRALAQKHWTAAMEMWDGKGFLDAATKHSQRYATYKLSLGLIAAARLHVTPPAGLRDKLLTLQAESGGWITDYDAQGKPIGLANVETTSLAILSLEAAKP